MAVILSKLVSPRVAFVAQTLVGELHDCIIYSPGTVIDEFQVDADIEARIQNYEIQQIAAREAQENVKPPKKEKRFKDLKDSILESVPADELVEFKAFLTGDA